MLKKINLWAGFIFSCCLSVSAQSRLVDTLLLKEVVVVPVRQTFSTGYSVAGISALRKKDYDASSLTSLLSDQTGVVVNSYGPLGQASIAMRGTSSSQTAVVWNGINLQSSMNGGVDLSLIACQGIDQVDVQLGGSSALYGSGAVGGVVFLNNSTEIQKGVRVSATQHWSSFETRNSMATVSIGSDCLVSTTKLSYFTSQNNFPFYNTESTGKLDTVRNAAQYHWSVLQSLNWKLNPSNRFSAFAWLLGSRYHLAQTMLQTEMPSTQDDQNARFVCLWENRSSIFTNTTHLAWVNELENYDSPAIHSRHNPQTATAEFESKAQFDQDHALDIGLLVENEKCVSTDYAGLKLRNRLAISGAYKQSSFKNQLETGLNLRGELVDGHAIPFTASLGWEYKPKSFLSFKGTFSKNFRLPTFNDLYWSPGGNAALKPENGLSSDLGLVFKNVSDAWNYRLTATAFTNVVKDMIVWLPTNGGIYSPMNFDQVWSCGLELGVHTSATLQKLQLICDVNYTYTRSTKMRNGSYTSDQMIYIPEHKVSLFASLAYSRYRLSYTQRIESIRNYSESLPDKKPDQIEGYGLGNLSLSSSMQSSGWHCSIGAKINNVWNASYQVMPWYPMPLRNYSLFISFDFGS